MSSTKQVCFTCVISCWGIIRAKGHYRQEIGLVSNSQVSRGP